MVQNTTILRKYKKHSSSSNLVSSLLITYASGMTLLRWQLCPQKYINRKLVNLLKIIQPKKMAVLGKKLESLRSCEKDR